jgi:hypothetical protein
VTSSWKRATVLTICRGCSNWIHAGEPMQHVTFGRTDDAGRLVWRITRLLCVRCADGPVTDGDIPDYIPAPKRIAPTGRARGPLFATIGPMSSTGQLGRDWKQRQAGREPGEDDA